MGRVPKADISVLTEIPRKGFLFPHGRRTGVCVLCCSRLPKMAACRIPAPGEAAGEKDRRSTQRIVPCTANRLLKKSVLMASLLVVDWSVECVSRYPRARHSWFWMRCRPPQIFDRYFGSAEESRQKKVHAERYSPSHESLSFGQKGVTYVRQPSSAQQFLCGHIT